MELLILFILVLLLTLLVTKYKEHQEKHILQSVTHIIHSGYMHNNQIHVVDLCRFSNSDDVNEAYLFFNRLKNKGKIKASVTLIGTNSEGSYRHFQNERKGIEEYDKKEEVEVAM